MTKYVSTPAAPVLVSVGGTIISPSNEVKSAGFDTSKDTTETTGSGDTAKTYLGTQADATFSFEGFASNTTSGSATSAMKLFETAYASATPTAIIVYGSGSASGAPTETASVVIQSVNKSHGHNEVSALTVTGQVTAGVAFGNV